MTTLKAVSSRIRFLLLLPLFTAGAVHGAPKSFVQQAQNPFDNNGDSLPDLGMAQPTTEGEKHLAEMAKAFGEASMIDNGLTAGQQARQFAFGKVRDAVSGEVNEQIESWLSPGVTPMSMYWWMTTVTLTAAAEAGLSPGATTPAI
ncbi:hypothetical protein MOG78_03910 [Enterobacter hormaechei]|nr:hypothetical protein MOG78_03910 [Enterobacter hormaechei]